MNDSLGVSALDESILEETEETEVTSTLHCEKCHYSSNYKHNLKRQIVLKHPAKTTTVENTEVFYQLCDQCGLRFISKFGLRPHAKYKHEQTYRFTCDSCGKGFQGLWNFRGHLRSHNEKLKEKCAFCPKTFTYRSSLLKHESTHGEFTERPLSACEPCGTDYKYGKNRKEHVRGVHGGKKYTCSICLKAFRWRSSLSYHIKHVKHN